MYNPHPTVSNNNIMFRCTLPVNRNPRSVIVDRVSFFFGLVQFGFLLLLFFVRCLHLESIIWLQIAQETSKVCFGPEIH